jgi:hypothetical protein
LSFSTRRSKKLKPPLAGTPNEVRPLICHVRLKRSGAWWLEANGNAMLRIRRALYNGTFKQIFDDYMAATHGSGNKSPSTNAERSRARPSTTGRLASLVAPALQLFHCRLLHRVHHGRLLRRPVL